MSVLSVLSPNVARYTKAIVHELLSTGEVLRPGTEAWRNRIHNAARKAGVKIQTSIEDGNCWGWVVDE